jgi:hypothetical protein
MSKEFPEVYNIKKSINLMSSYFSIFLKESKSVKNNITVKGNLPVYNLAVAYLN